MLGRLAGKTQVIGRFDWSGLTTPHPVRRIEWRIVSFVPDHQLIAAKPGIAAQLGMVPQAATLRRT